MIKNINLYLNIYLSIILSIKVINLIVTIVYLASKYKKYEFTDNIKKVKDILHIIFNFLLIFLLIFLFNPFFKNRIEINDTIVNFLFAFAIMSLVTEIQIIIAN